MPEKDWEFWIDVGGTFTDCIARDPQGNLLRHKTLSSGTMKGTVHTGSSTSSIVDPARRRDPAGFWNGWSLRLVDAVGRILTETLSHMNGLIISSHKREPRPRRTRGALVPFPRWMNSTV